MPDPIKFSADYERVARETGVSLRAARNTVIQQAARAVVLNTPVDTGRLRASWFWSSTFPATGGPASEFSPDALTSQQLSAMSGGLADLERSIFFLNGANYAKYVEARQQFVRRTLGRSTAITSAAIGRITSLRGRFK